MVRRLRAMPDAAPGPGARPVRPRRSGLATAAWVATALASVPGAGCFDATQPILEGADPETEVLTLQRSFASHVNEDGLVAGFLEVGDDAFLWDGDRLWTLPTATAVESRVRDLDDDGWASATLVDGDGRRRPLLWNGPETRLLEVPGDDWGGAWGRNASGLVVGWTSEPSQPVRPATWRDGAFQPLMVPGLRSGWARAVNDRGDILVYGETATGRQGAVWLVAADGTVRQVNGLDAREIEGPTLTEDGRVVGGALRAGRSCFSSSGACIPFVWEDGIMRELPMPGATGRAIGIAADGTIVGTVADPDGTPIAVAWRDGGPPEPLGDFGDGRSQVEAVSARGEVVGSSTLAGVSHAFLWSDGDFLFLDTRGPPGSWAYAVNERGWVVGATGVESTDDFHAVVWRPGS